MLRFFFAFLLSMVEVGSRKHGIGIKKEPETIPVSGLGE